MNVYSLMNEWSYKTMTDTFILKSPNNGEYELPCYEASVGPNVFDIRSVYGSSGFFTYDPGFASTAACESKITYIDGEAGILLHRGYTISDLASKKSFTEVAYLIINGELPNASEKEAFEKELKKRQKAPEQLAHVFSAFDKNAHPMALLMTAVSALSSYYHDDIDVTNADSQKEVMLRMIAVIPTLSAMVFKHIHGEKFVSPEDSLSYAENFLHMCFSKEGSSYKAQDSVIDIMDKIFILHADHEQNASTSTVRLAGSSDANPIAAIGAGVATLWGPAHGGANEAVLKMLGEIGNKDRIPEFVTKAKDKNDPFRLMGFGHRVYKNFDPRAHVLKESCKKVLSDLGVEDPLFELALELEKLALQDDYFVERKLFPNVDFYSGIILKAIGFPTHYFTVLFALARTTGWVAQWHEMISDPKKRIGRPRQLYTGPTQRSL